MPVYQLTNTQVRTLHALLEEDGLTREEVARRLGVSQVDMGGSRRHGPSLDPNSLYNLGYVRPEAEYDGKETVRYYLTDAGVEAARSFKARRVSYAVVPNEVLDPVVIAFRRLRTYGLEQYTERDWEELRANLPEQYHDVPLVALRNQVCNRRKTGAYKEVKMLRCWICGSIDDLDKVDTDSKKGMVLCEACRERNDPYFN